MVDIEDQRKIEEFVSSLSPKDREIVLMQVLRSLEDLEDDAWDEDDDDQAAQD